MRTTLGRNLLDPKGCVNQHRVRIGYQERKVPAPPEASATETDTVGPSGAFVVGGVVVGGGGVVANSMGEIVAMLSTVPSNVCPSATWFLITC